MRHRHCPEWLPPLGLALGGSLFISYATVASPQPGQPALAVLYSRNLGFRSLLEADPELRVIGTLAGGAFVLIDFKRADLADTRLPGVATVLLAPPVSALCQSPR